MSLENVMHSVGKREGTDLSTQNLDPFLRKVLHSLTDNLVSDHSRLGELINEGECEATDTQELIERAEAMVLGQPYHTYTYWDSDRETIVTERGMALVGHYDKWPVSETKLVYSEAKGLQLKIEDFHLKAEGGVWQEEAMLDDKLVSKANQEQILRSCVRVVDSLHNRLKPLMTTSSQATVGQIRKLIADARAELRYAAGLLPPEDFKMEEAETKPEPQPEQQQCQNCGSPATPGGRFCQYCRW